MKATWAARVCWALPPALGWLASSLITWAVAASSDVSYWSTAGRWRWDSEHYLSISTSGYEMFRCRDRYANFPDVLCGNVAWFPGYPVLLRPLTWTGLSYDAAGVVVSELALLGMFVVLWMLLGARLTWANGLTLALGTVFLGGVYFHAIFPISLLTLALMLSVLAVTRGWWWLAALSGFVATAAHPAGAVVLGMLALSWLFGWQDDDRRARIAKAAGAAAVAGFGLLWVRWLMWRATGRWDAYDAIQASSYGQGGVRNPFAAARDFFTMPFADYYAKDRDLSWLVEHSLAAHQAQLWVNTAFVVLVLGFTLHRLVRDRRLEPLEWAAVVITGAAFVVPFLAGATMSWYRAHALLFVALILVARLPRWVQFVLLLVCAIQYARLTSMFFAGVLV